MAYVDMAYIVMAERRTGQRCIPRTFCRHLPSDTRIDMCANMCTDAAADMHMDMCADM